MAKLTLTIDRDNAAFDDGNDGRELARILRALASRLEGDAVGFGGDVSLFDLNGNRVGACLLDRRPAAAYPE